MNENELDYFACLFNHMPNIKEICYIREGLKKKKKKLWKIPYRVLTPPPVKEIFFIFFLKLDHFLRTFCKKCIFTIENPKKLRKFFKK